MILANHSDRDRTIFLNDVPYCIPAMGFISMPETVEIDRALEAFRKTNIGKALFDMGIFSFTMPNRNEKPISVKGPNPPEELMAPSNNRMIQNATPVLTGETVKV